MFGDLSCGEASGASCGFSVDTGIGGLNLMPMGQPQGLPLRRRGDTNLVGAGLVPAQFACCNHIAKTLIIPIAGTQFTITCAIEAPLLQVPPARRGNRTRARFPSRSGGNLKEGGNCKLCPCDWYNKRLCDMIATCESGRHKTCPYKVGVAAPP